MPTLRQAIRSVLLRPALALALPPVCLALGLVVALLADALAGLLILAAGCLVALTLVLFHLLLERGVGVEAGGGHIDRRRRQHIIRQNMDAAAIAQISRDFPEIPAHCFTAGSMAPANLTAILGHLTSPAHAATPQTIVEFGPGYSTLVLAAQLRRLGHTDAHITSFEHDEKWAAFFRSAIDALDLSDLITLHVTPLIEGSSSDPIRRTRFYDYRIAHFPDAPITLLIVDGPPASGPAHARCRAAALPAVYDRLAESCTVFLDDATRPGETAVLQQWQSLYPEFDLTIHPTSTGLAMLTRG